METHTILVQVYESQAVSKNIVYHGFTRFCDGNETVDNEPYSGQLPTRITQDNIEGVQRMVADYRQLSFIVS